jgi:hypothetical protein
LVWVYGPYQATLREIEDLTKLDFGKLSNHDSLEKDENEHLPEAVIGAVQISGTEQIVL